MKTYETAKDVLNAIIEFHHLAASLLSRIRKQSMDEKTTMLLDYLHQHQVAMHQHLSRYVDHAEPAVLDTWLPYSLNAASAPAAFVNGLDAAAPSLETAEHLAQALASYVIQLLEGVAEEVSSDKVRSCFDSILEMERNEQHRLTRAINSLGDM